MKNKKVSFTVIQHGPRLELGLSLNDYCVADTVYHLSNNPKNKMGGWCWKSKENIGEQLGLSKQTIHRILKTLLVKKLIIKNEASHLKTTYKWFDTVVLGSKNSLPRVTNEEEKSGKKVTTDSSETLHNNNIDKNSENSFSVEKRLPSSIKVKEQTLMVLQSFEDIFNAEYQSYPSFGIKEIKCVDRGIAELGVNDALQLVEDWFDSPKIFPDLKTDIAVAFSNKYINKWKGLMF